MKTKTKKKKKGKTIGVVICFVRCNDVRRRDFVTFNY